MKLPLIGYTAVRFTLMLRAQDALVHELSTLSIARAECSDPADRRLILGHLADLAASLTQANLAEERQQDRGQSMALGVEMVTAIGGGGGGGASGGHCGGGGNDSASGGAEGGVDASDGGGGSGSADGEGADQKDHAIGSGVKGGQSDVEKGCGGIGVASATATSGEGSAPPSAVDEIVLQRAMTLQPWLLSKLRPCLNHALNTAAQVSMPLALLATLPSTFYSSVEVLSCSGHLDCDVASSASGGALITSGGQDGT